jgi:hypothetical protein
MVHIAPLWSAAEMSDPPPARAHAHSARRTDAPAPSPTPATVQIDKNVEREILNHRMLNNTHVIAFREVGRPGPA